MYWSVDSAPFPCWPSAQNNSVRAPIMTFCIVTEDPPTYQICPVLATLRKDNKSDIWWSTWLFQHHQWWSTKPLSFINLYRRVRKWLSSPLLRAPQPSQRQIKQKSPFLCNKYKIDASFPNLMNQIIVLTPIPSKPLLGAPVHWRCGGKGELQLRKWQLCDNLPVLPARK